MFLCFHTLAVKPVLTERRREIALWPLGEGYGRLSGSYGLIRALGSLVEDIAVASHPFEALGIFTVPELDLSLDPGKEDPHSPALEI